MVIKIEPNSNLKEAQAAVASVFAAVSSHRGAPITIDQLTQIVTDSLGCSRSYSEGLVASTLTFLQLMALIEWHENDSFCIPSQIPDYFIHSILWYLEHDQQILSNWDSVGVSREIIGSNLLDKAPYFLKAIEQRRIELSNRLFLEPGYSRIQPGVILLIRTNIGGEPYFLHQWDTKAEQFQLIGGRKRPNEDHLETAKRELAEELTGHDFVYGTDYELAFLNKDRRPMEWSQISRTYGALTHYKLWIYAVKFNIPTLHLSDIDRWISLAEMHDGFTKMDKKKIVNGERLRILETCLQGGLKCIPISINIKHTVNFLSYVEIKLRMFGVSFNLKEFLKNNCGWLKRKWGNVEKD